MSYSPGQTRTFFKQEITFAGAGAGTQNFTLATTLADYTKASIRNFYSASLSQADLNSFHSKRRLTSNTNLEVTGTTGAGDKAIIFEIEEFQNLPA